MLVVLARQLARGGLRSGVGSDGRVGRARGWRKELVLVECVEGPFSAGRPRVT